MINLIYIIILCLIPVSAIAAPSVSSTSGSISHGLTITISGSDFGTKSPAAPLMWDDMEGETAGNFPIGSANDDSQVGYSGYQPGDTRGDEDIPDNAEMNYREFPHTHVTTAVTAPHSRSTQFLGGAHYEDDIVDDANHSGRDVMLTVATPSTFADRWYASWYYRVNPEWPSCGTSPNHKITVFQAGTVGYSNSPYTNQFFYMVIYPNDYQPCGKQSQSMVIAHGRECCNGSGYTGDYPDTTPPWETFISAGENANNISSSGADDEWIKIEQITSNDQGNLYFYIDNQMLWGGEGNTDFYTGSGANDIGDDGIRSFTLGGYWREDLNVNTVGYQNTNAFRYFDDVYIDSTLSRVVLTDNATYSSSTIIEPQIPSAWSTTEITVKLNLGALTGSTAYMFVFDADGDANATGYAVTLDSASTTISTGSNTTISSGNNATIN